MGNQEKMKKTITILSILILLFSCQSNIETNEENPKVKLSKKVESKIEPKQQQEQILKGNKTKEKPLEEPIKSEAKKSAKLVIDNEIQYSKKFITQLRRTNGMEEIEFNNGIMILNQKDSISFPEIPTINRSIVFTGRKEDLAIALTVKRINYTSIEYRLEIVEFGKSSKTTKGIADLGGFFFFGGESDTDELTKENYFSTEFTNKIDSCYTNIRIGNSEDSEDFPLLAKIVKNCNQEITTVDLDNFPTLREK
jgi:hypothetical protein